MAPTLPAVGIGESGMPGANGLVPPAEGDLLGADVAGAGDVLVGHGWSTAAVLAMALLAGMLSVGAASAPSAVDCL